MPGNRHYQGSDIYHLEHQTNTNTNVTYEYYVNCGHTNKMKM